MNKLIFILVVWVSIIFISQQSLAQTTIWSENFSSNSDGDGTGNDNNLPAGADWTSGNCTTCPGDANDWWEVRSNRMEARDVNNETPFLQTELIDISTYVGVSFSVLVTEAGDHEGFYLNTANCTDQSNEDFADISYRINGGAWIKVTNFLGWCGLYGSCASHTLMGDEGSVSDCRATDADWVSANVSVTGLSGSTIEILCEARNSSGSEFIQFDDIIVQGFSVLPVTFLSVSGEYRGTHTLIQWETATETNNSYFEVQRSVDGFTFEPIGRVNGAGTSSVFLEYEFTDNDADQFIGRPVYYRIKQVDLDGQYEYSTIVITNPKQQIIGDLLLYPNPTRNELNLQFVTEGIEPLQLRIFDLMGREVYQQTYAVTRGQNDINIQLNDLIPGVYTTTISNGREFLTESFVKH